MKTTTIVKMTVMLSLLLIIAACGSNEVQNVSDESHKNPETNQTEETSEANHTETEGKDEISAYPFLVWANGGTFKIILDENLPDKLIGKKLGEVSSTLSDEEVGRLEEGQTYRKLDRIDGESNYLKQGTAIYQLKKADANEVVLVEHQGSLYKAVRIGN